VGGDVGGLVGGDVVNCRRTGLGGDVGGLVGGDVGDWSRTGRSTRKRCWRPVGGMSGFGRRTGRWRCRGSVGGEGTGRLARSTRGMTLADWSCFRTGRRTVGGDVGDRRRRRRGLVGGLVGPPVVATLRPMARCRGLVGDHRWRCRGLWRRRRGGSVEDWSVHPWVARRWRTGRRWSGRSGTGRWRCRGLVGGDVGDWSVTGRSTRAATLVDCRRRCRWWRTGRWRCRGLVGGDVGDCRRDCRSTRGWRRWRTGRGGDVGGLVEDRSGDVGGLVGGDVGDWSEDWSVHPWVADAGGPSAAMSGDPGGLVGGDVGDRSARRRGDRLWTGRSTVGTRGPVAAMSGGLVEDWSVAMSDWWRRRRGLVGDWSVHPWWRRWRLVGAMSGPEETGRWRCRGLVGGDVGLSGGRSVHPCATRRTGRRRCRGPGRRTGRWRCRGTGRRRRRGLVGGLVGPPVVATLADRSAAMSGVRRRTGRWRCRGDWSTSGTVGTGRSTRGVATLADWSDCSVAR
jgi:hypothetical protein